MNTATETGLRIEASREGSATVLRVAGDVDAANAHQLREAVITAIEGGSAVVVVDLSSVGYVDSVGLGTLVVSLKRAAERGTALRLVVTSPQIEKVLKITGLLSVFDTYPDAAAAIKGRS
jgi:anti-sigma B factor antagonist